MKQRRNAVQAFFETAAVALCMAAFAVMLSGCTPAKLAEPETFSEKLAYAYSTLATVRTGAANALNSKLIKVEDAEHVQRVADDVRAALDTAKAINASGDLTTAMGKLNAATVLLKSAQNYLAATTSRP